MNQEEHLNELTLADIIKKYLTEEEEFEEIRKDRSWPTPEEEEIEEEERRQAAAILAIRENIRHFLSGAPCQTPPTIFEVIEHGSPYELTKFLKKMPIANTPDERGEYPIIFASGKGKLNAVNILYKNGADPNARNAKGQTALMAATNNDRFSMFKHLFYMKNPADGKVVVDIDMQDNKGNTALLHAIRNNILNIAYKLVEYCADITPEAEDHETAYTLACKKWLCPSILSDDINEQFFLKMYHAELGMLVEAMILDSELVNTPVHMGRTALMLAAEYGEPGDIELLLSNGADKTLQDPEGKTALQFAREAHREENAQAII